MTNSGQSSHHPIDSNKNVAHKAVSNKNDTRITSVRTLRLEKLGAMAQIPFTRSQRNGWNQSLAPLRNSRLANMLAHYLQRYYVVDNSARILHLEQELQYSHHPCTLSWTCQPLDTERETANVVPNLDL